jgi:alginate O-acetyltransferase complex protein AlgI
VHYALYVVFFPQLIAGPIIRFHQIAPQIRMRSSSWEAFGSGAVRFCFGLAKKTLVADRIGEIATAVFSTPAQQLDTPTAWLGAMAYTFQLYFDFSGYSDMAIGLARMFGFQFPENFLRPYSATSITDFWRRWHVTLSAWFRDYLYIPLGGSHRGTLRTYAHLVIVFLATGLWHGASWTFVIWGAYHGALLIVERLTGLRTTTDPVRVAPLRRGLTFLLVVLGWVIFRSENLAYAGSFYQAMFSANVGPIDESIRASLTMRNLLMLAGASGIIFVPRDFSGGAWLVEAQGPAATIVRACLMLAVLPLSVLAIVSADFHPFLYFRF